MKYTKPIVFWLLTLFVCCAVITANAQTAPQNYTSVNIDDLSDSQIKQLLQQGQNAGLSDNDIIKDAENKGLPASQSQKLQQRITAIRKKDATTVTTSDNLSANRSLNYQLDTAIRTKNLRNQPSKIFGADLFRNSNTSFEPNLKLATPVNYIVGPDDQLDVSVYGNSVVNWKLTVSPDGNINLPSGGIVNVAGKTIDEATALIKSRLISKNYAIGNGSTLKVTLGNIRSIKVLMVGEITKPGTYTLPSLATAFNALYVAGGPGDNGSFRQIEIIRNSRIIRRLDLYDFFVKGSRKDDISLQDQDIIRVPTYNTIVEVKGEVKTNAIFEVLPGETLQDVIRFAGGYTNQAYRANIKVSQISDKQRRISDVSDTNYKNYVPLAGDVYTVERIIDRYENRVVISGAVVRPGEYELQKNMSLFQLIDKASGLKEDAFTQRGTILRLNADNTTQLISFNVNDVIGKSTNVILQREDVVNIQSIFEIRDKYTVKISGEIRNPGEYAYADSMKLENLLLMAGGFSEGASKMQVEVARRVYDNDARSKESTIAKVYNLNIGDNLKPGSSDFTLKPFDIVLVYKRPGFEKQSIVKVEGEVLYAGPYVIQKKNEKISDIVSRAGGLTAFADADGSTLKRNYVVSQGSPVNRNDTTESAIERSRRISQLKQRSNDTSSVSSNHNNLIGINLVEILQKPGSGTDLIVKDGDVITVPQQQQVVQVNGEVRVPSGVVFTPGDNFRSYIINAGGYASDALKKGAYIIYPNGSIKGTRNFLFFRKYPLVRPGSNIYVPVKPATKGINFAEIAGIISALGTTVVLAIISLRR